MWDALPAAVAAGALLTGAVAVPAGDAAAASACSSLGDRTGGRALARRLGAGIQAALRGRA
jgi:hypothetical protein